jgi:hypothetical protein
MLVTNHVLSGALIGHASPYAALAFPVGIVSHLALDAVPHWGVARPIHDVLHVAVPDGLVGATMMLVLTVVTDRDHRLRVLAGMAGAVLLDLDKPSILFFGSSPFPAPVDRLHALVQRESPRRMPQEVLVGAAGLLAVAVVTRRRRSRVLG